MTIVAILFLICFILGFITISTLLFIAPLYEGKVKERLLKIGIVVGKMTGLLLAITILIWLRFFIEEIALGFCIYKFGTLALSFLLTYYQTCK